MTFVCPQCRQPLNSHAEAYTCLACNRDFPILCGIPDFRLHPDPYIGIEADRKKGAALHEATKQMTFAEAVRYYYSITPEDPADLADIWTARALAEVEIARKMLPAEQKALLDIGCSTGGVLIANQGGTGVDVAFRWLILGRLRLQEACIQATLVCANAEHLPFPNQSFQQITSFDTLEHLRDANEALKEMRRVGARLLLTSNNRWSPLPEPHVHLWGAAWLPRSWQQAYIAQRRGDLHPYKITLRSASEGKQMATAAGWQNVTVEAAPMHGPHLNARAQAILRLYNHVRKLPGLTTLAPRWLLRA